MRRALVLGIFILLASSLWSEAQTPGTARVVSSCGSVSYTAGANNPVTVDTTGNLCSNGAGGGSSNVVITPSAATAAATSTTTTAALAANLVVKASAGNLYSFEASADTTLSGAAWWLMIYDAASAPADGAVTPQKCYAFASGTTMASFAFPTPIPFATGITIGVSTTGCFTKTASVHAFISGDYK